MKNETAIAEMSIKPSWLLVVNSCFIILLSFAFICMSIYVLFSAHDDFMRLVSLIFLGIAIPLGVLQYFVTFKRSVKSFYLLSVYFCIIGAWPLFLWISKACQSSPNNSNLISTFSIYCLLLILYMGFCVILNLHWVRIIKKKKLEIANKAAILEK